MIIRIQPPLRELAGNLRLNTTARSEFKRIVDCLSWVTAGVLKVFYMWAGCWNFLSQFHFEYVDPASPASIYFEIMDPLLPYFEMLGLLFFSHPFFKWNSPYISFVDKHIA